MARHSILQVAVAALVAAAGSSTALAQGTAFTYQGQLKNGGSVVNTPSDFRFSLFTAASGGTQIGSAVTALAVPVSDGVFTREVDFGANAYVSSQNLFLQIEVRNPAGSGAFVAMGSRQLLTPAPFSLATRGLDVDASGNVSLLPGANRTIRVPNEPPNAQSGLDGKNLSIVAGNSSIPNFSASKGGSILLQAGTGNNSSQPGAGGGDVILRSGTNALSAAPGAPNGGSIVFETGGAVNTFNERMRVTEKGAVGIGTSSPISRLEVVTLPTSLNDPVAIFRNDTCGGPCAQEAYTENVRLVNTSVSGQTGIGFMTEPGATINSVSDVWVGTGFGADAGDQANDFVIATKINATTLSNRFRINGDNGNVGIGTDSPQARLHNVGTSRLDGDVLLGVQTWNGSTGSNGKLTRFSHSGGNASNVVLDMSSSVQSVFIIQNNGVDRIYLGNDGLASKPGGGSWAALCDERTKNDIQPMTGTLDRLLKLKGHAYTYKPEFVEKGRALPGVQIGLVAQEVETIFPDWVSTGTDGLKQVTERSTTALMVEALRDLRTEKDNEIANLKARLEKLEALLSAQAK